jgi:excisionase family DNA binding protein
VNGERLLTIVETAETLGCSQRTIRRRISEGALPAFRDRGLCAFARAISNAKSSGPSEFCDRPISRQIAKAASARSTDPQAARRLWERIDREVTDQAPLLPLLTPESVEVLGVGNYQDNSNGFGMLIDQLWVR